MTAQASAPSPRVLIVCALFKLPYRVAQCASAAGATVFMLGGARSSGLRLSNRIEAFHPSRRPITGEADPDLAAQINDLAASLGVDMVLAGDAPSTRSLIAVRDLIRPACFPMPTLEQFDLLNNKWEFARLCGELGIAHPETLLYQGVAELSGDIAAGKIRLPRIAKPLSRDSAVGFVAIAPDSVSASVSKIFYAPIIVQEYIPGIDISASVYARDGEILAFVAFKYRRATYETFRSHPVYDDVARIVRRMNLTGVINFDMRLTPGGEVTFIECNPRFFFRMTMAMLGGINFLAFGLPGAPRGLRGDCDDVVVQYPRAVLANLATPWRLRAKTWPALKFVLSDPLPYLREEFGLENLPRAGDRP